MDNPPDTSAPRHVGPLASGGRFKVRVPVTPNPHREAGSALPIVEWLRKEAQIHQTYSSAMTDTMREKIARAVGVARHGFASPGTIAQHGLIALEGLDHHIADSVLALIEPVMEENERLRSLVRKHVTFAGRKFPESVAEEARATLSLKSEKQDG